jgi:hypothetical protein
MEVNWGAKFETTNDITVAAPIPAAALPSNPPLKTEVKPLFAELRLEDFLLITGALLFVLFKGADFRLVVVVFRNFVLDFRTVFVVFFLNPPDFIIFENFLLAASCLAVAIMQTTPDILLR